MGSIPVSPPIYRKGISMSYLSKDELLNEITKWNIKSDLTSYEVSKFLAVISNVTVYEPSKQEVMVEYIIEK